MSPPNSKRDEPPTITEWTGSVKEDSQSVSRDEVRASSIPFDRIPFDHDHCFLCGRHVGESGTREHMFPKWLQHRFHLWDKRLQLLNGTSIPYRRLTVPCCGECNNDSLSRLENEVRDAVEAGHEGVAQLPHVTLFQWAGKLLFAVLFKEMSLLYDRKSPSLGTILEPSHLDAWSTLHDLLQSVRVPARFIGGPFASILVCRLHIIDEAPSFDFADSVDDQVVAIRMGSIGLVASLADGGISDVHWSKILAAYGNHPLHPIQFDEMLVHMVYERRRMTRSIKYMMAASHGDGSNLTFVKLPGFTLQPLLRPFDADEFKPLLQHFMSRWGRATESLWNRSEGVGTTIFERPGHVALCGPDFQVERIVPYEEISAT